MLAGIYTFFCRFESAAVLPVFKGSTLRGGLGHSLKKISCALRQRECGNCLLSNNCAYAFLFEVKNSRPVESGKTRVAHRPHPYVLFPPEKQKRAYEKDETFTFGLVLFGRANTYLPHIVYAVQEMGKTGLGKRSSEPGRFLLETVRMGEDILFDGSTLRQSQPVPQLCLQSPAEGAHDKISLSCLTPLRLKHGNELQGTLPFHFVIRAALRRVASLEAVYGNGEPDIDYRTLAARAGEVEIDSSDCRWVDIERYSNRQRSSMLFGGVQGRIIYCGDNLEDFLPLLRYCEIVNLGKQTSFGLGRISVGEM
ncbi:MAG: hypothetical protein BM485_02050 [Desulfobulbaceae bacterium DB1]|nr:MAG: hypothetical protein BM485_02050 [Desulfobulbaceae bacterium DB1]